MDTSLRSLYRNAAEWMAGPAGSILIHVGIILAAIFLFTFVKTEKEDAGVEVTVVEVDDVTLDEELEPEQIDDLEDLVDPVDIPEVDINMDVPDVEPDFSADSSMVSDMNELVIASDVSSPIVMKSLMAGNYANRSGAGRAGAGGYAGQWAKAAEVAVLRALEWLKNNQQADGSWGRKRDRATGEYKYEGTYNEAFTGLAILTFLAHGETTSSKDYGLTVRRALEYLVAKQNEKGEFAPTDTDHGTYTQCICTYAVSEAFGMMRIPELRSVMERAAQRIIDGQQANGAFDYKFAKQNQRDTSLSGWAGQALKAAYIAGAKTPGLKDTLNRIVAEVKTAARAEDGTFWYRNIGQSRHSLNITAIGVLTLQLLGHAEDPECKAGVKALAAATCDWQNPLEWPMYAWYYISQAKFHHGGNSWEKWNNEFAPQFIRAQNVDDPNDKAVYGSWISAGVNLPKNADGHEDNYDRIYATTLAALTLQVYYRHLPTYKPIQPIEEEAAADDDIAIVIE